MNTRQIAIPLMLGGLIVLPGCDAPEAPPSSVTPSSPNLPPVPAVMASELSALVQSSDKPVLVEFSVMAGCFRCDGMRPQLRQLADDVKDDVHVVRMDFNANQSLAASLGATVCPSYVLFSNGQPAWVQSYPTSSGLLSSRLAAELSTDADPNPESPPVDQSGNDLSPF